MSSDLVLLDKANGVATVTLNEPETLNALTYDMTLRLGEVVGQVAKDPEVRAVVLTGAGRGFCSGANLLGSTGAALTGGGMGVRAAIMEMNGVLVEVAEMQKPWVAAVNGPAVGGGCSLALVCDLALIAGSAYLCVGYVNVGMVTDMGASYLLPKLVGLRRANELAFFGERIHGPLAAEMGLVNRAVPDGELMDMAQAWAARLAAGPTLSIGAMKLAMRRAQEGTFRDALLSEATLLALIAQTEDAAEGLMAFFQKRKPEFKGR
ncbi:MAG: enoyl-CoA hydratase/isomerase family protein [Anaerolineae bacterium]|nr:enoyl-CoA hydratase/isomerase family protein [Anaerolineae bacterium]